MRRRTFLLAGLGATGALFVGWSLTPPRQRLHPGRAPVTGHDGVPLNGWLAVHPDGRVTVISPKAEMGQGIHTALAMLIAEELDCDWAQVRVVHSGVDRIYNNIAAILDGLPFHEDLEEHSGVRAVRWLTAKTVREVGVMMTGGSSSVRDVWEVARTAGATARAQLVAAAAARAGVAASACRTEAGVVHAGAQSFAYGTLVREAAGMAVRDVTLRDPAQYRLVGRDRARIDGDAIVRGAPRYSLDVRLPGMRYAAVSMAPSLGATVSGFRREALRDRAGMHAVVELPGSRYGEVPGVAVIADGWWQARQALAALDVQFFPGPHLALGSDDVAAQLRDAAHADTGLPFRSTGDAVGVLAAADRVLDVTYEAPYLAHATMEPMNATVRVTDAGVELWTSTQVPGVACIAAAEVAGVDVSRVTLHQQQLGGGFGRRLEVDYVAQAVRIAMAAPGVAVQTLWSREDDMRHDFYRPAAASRLRAALDARGVATSVVCHSASQAPFKALSQRIGIPYPSFVPDKTTAEGTWDQPYEFPAIRSTHLEVELPVPVGSWRAVGHSHQGFFFESFVDELAHAANADPLQYRLQLLRSHARARRVLETVARDSAWGSPLAPAADGATQARGVALHWSFGTVVAMVAELSLDAARRVRVHRLVCAVDCGLVVNPNGVRQQVEGGAIFGLSAALHGEVRLENGRIRPGNFNDYPPLRMSECPTIVTTLVPSTRLPSGIGEPALPVVAPAVANALFALTGTRLRTLPLRLPVAPPQSAPGTAPSTAS